MKDVLTVLEDPGFETMEGWKKKKENKEDVVYSKRFPFGKVFTLRVSDIRALVFKICYYCYSGRSILKQA